MKYNPFDENCLLIKKEYKKDNYKIIYNKKHDIKNRCVVYFSSNGWYEANSEKSFRKFVIKKERYEWQHCRGTKIPEKEIYIRDIWLSWYVKGINKRLDSIDKVLEFLRKETIGYEVVCVGNSAGGFMALIAGSYLDASLIFNFSGQYSLEKIITDNPLFCKLKHNADFEKYIACYKQLKDIPTIYFCPYKVWDDNNQLKEAQKFSNTLCFKFDSSEHGKTAYSFNLPFVLDWSFKEAKEFYKIINNKEINAYDFSVHLIGKKETDRNIKVRKLQMKIRSIKSKIKDIVK